MSLSVYSCFIHLSWCLFFSLFGLWPACPQDLFILFNSNPVTLHTVCTTVLCGFELYYLCLAVQIERSSSCTQGACSDLHHG